MKIRVTITMNGTVWHNEVMENDSKVTWALIQDYVAKGFKAEIEPIS